MINATVGNYRVVEKIGDGGMGTVYRAIDQMLDREVALKVMKPELSRQTALNERFRQEAIALARLNHPHIAAVYGLERNGEDLVMVMEFIRGETLESIVQRSGRVAWARALELCSDVLEALDHAHDKGVVHRDIKPANIMLTRDGMVKVMDFGIARILGRSRQTRVGAAVGTPMYMSPEQLKGEEVDGRSDLYSLGAVLFELVTGRMAFEADSDYELMMKQLNDPPPPVRSIVSEVPETVEDVLQRSMAKRREDRYRHATDMRIGLQQALATSAAPVRRPPP
ncbi:MAG: serine/threonine-protein kinase, partial [Gemmatimonadaceae bacterium]